MLLSGAIVFVAPRSDRFTRSREVSITFAAPVGILWWRFHLVRFQGVRELAESKLNVRPHSILNVIKTTACGSAKKLKLILAGSADPFAFIRPLWRRLKQPWIDTGNAAGRAAEMFLDELNRAIGRISQHPRQFSAYEFGARGIVLRRLPYLVESIVLLQPRLSVLEHGDDCSRGFLFGRSLRTTAPTSNTVRSSLSSGALGRSQGTGLSPSFLTC
jgi:hypothetical protein